MLQAQGDAKRRERNQKPKECKCCGETFPAEQMERFPAGWFKGIDHALAYAKVKRERALEKERKAEKKARTEKVRNFRMKDLSHQRELTQKAVNRLCAALDKGLPCISCGRPYSPDKRRNASHLKSVGSNSYLRYHLCNIHDACMPCNQHLSGNIEGYKKGLIERHGQAMLDFLENAPRVKAWTAEELTAIRLEALAEIRRLERGESPSKNWRKL